MNILSVCVLAVVTVIFIAALRPKNAEIAVMLGLCASVVILFSLFSNIAQITDKISEITAASGISTGYIAILLKVIGICLVTEFTANVCRDSGSSSLAGTVTLTGKILVTIAALPLYSDILNVVLELVKR